MYEVTWFVMYEGIFKSNMFFCLGRVHGVLCENVGLVIVNLILSFV